MTVEELLALPARLDALERCLAELGTRPRWQPVIGDAPTLALWTPELTMTELAVLPYVAAGWSGQQIADERGISERTARKHVSNILSRLGLASRTEVALWALATGQVKVEEAVRLLTQQQPHLRCGEE